MIGKSPPGSFPEKHAPDMIRIMSHLETIAALEIVNL
jgi:hypothetical protein